MRWTKEHDRKMNNEIEKALENKANELDLDDFIYLDQDIIDEITDDIKCHWEYDHDLNNSEY